MPALIFLRRKWLIACDDFVILCGTEAILRIIWCVATLTLIWLKINNCADFVPVNYFLYATAGDLILASFLSLCTAIISARGSTLEVEKRKLLSRLLFIKLFMILCDIAIASFGIWLFIKMEGTCITKEIFIKITTVFALMYFLLIIFGILVCHDSLGSAKYWNVEANINSLNFFKKAQYIWRMRLKLFCCCADISEDKNDFIYVEISSFLSSFLNGIDLVPTDILTGIITLSQKHVLERRKHMLVHMPRSIELLENTPVPDWMTAQNALYFLRIAKSTYGWLSFFDAFHPWKLCVLSPLARCCSEGNETKIDNCCYLNTAAVERITGFQDSDIIYASFKNSIYEPAFYVAINHSKKYVIIAVRGTRSFSDLITDIDAECLYFPTESDHKFKCHRGTLRSALFLQKQISELKILEVAFAENPSYILALTGHSLGGGIAAVLALILHPKYPDLQCYAYGPLAVLSAQGIPETLSCILTVVQGEDVAPRLCATSCIELRKQLMESLGESKTPKYQILTGACWYHVQKYFKMQPNRVVSEVHENKLYENDEDNVSQQDDSIACEDSKLYAPGRILYFEKKNWCKPYWLTGLNLQNIIINPSMIADHQPHNVQNTIEMYIKSLEDFQTVII